MQNFRIKNCLFGTVRLKRNAHLFTMVEEFAFGSAIDWSYDNDFARIFNNS